MKRERGWIESFDEATGLGIILLSDSVVHILPKTQIDVPDPLEPGDAVDVEFINSIASKIVAVHRLNSETRRQFKNQIADFVRFAWDNGILKSLYDLHKREGANTYLTFELMLSFYISGILKQEQLPHINLSEKSADFTITFDPRLTEEQITLGFAALADYFRGCGGVGLKVSFEQQGAETMEPARV